MGMGHLITKPWGADASGTVGGHPNKRDLPISFWRIQNQAQTAPGKPWAVRAAFPIHSNEKGTKGSSLPCHTRATCDYRLAVTHTAKPLQQPTVPTTKPPVAPEEVATSKHLSFGLPS